MPDPKPLIEPLHVCAQDKFTHSSASTR